MKIAMIGGVNIPKNGGLEMYMFNLAKQLHKDGHCLWIICIGDDDKDEIVDGIRITSLKTASGFWALYGFLKKATNMVVKSKEKYDVINYHRFYFTKWLIKNAREAGIKTCFTNHSFALDNPKHSFIKKIALYILSFWGFGGIKNCITVSDYGAYQLKSRFGNDSTIIRGGVFVPEEKDDTDILERNGIRKGDYYLSISRIDPVKELDTLIRAFKKHSSSSTTQLVIAGNIDNEYGRLLVKEANGDKRIIFAGPVFGEDKNTLLKHSLAYCLVSRSEGFPIALLEAMVYSSICLVSNIPANREALTTDLGLWSEVGDANSIYSNMELLETGKIDSKKIKEKTRGRVLLNFTWQKSASYYINFLKSL